MFAVMDVNVKWVTGGWYSQAEVTQRLSNAKAVSKVAPVRTHQDLAKKLQVIDHYRYSRRCAIAAVSFDSVIS